RRCLPPSSILLPYTTLFRSGQMGVAEVFGVVRALIPAGDGHPAAAQKLVAVVADKPLRTQADEAAQELEEILGQVVEEDLSLHLRRGQLRHRPDAADGGGHILHAVAQERRDPPEEIRLVVVLHGY